MATKQETPSWEGLLNPARVMTSDEIEELGETCSVCASPAHVVEAVGTVTEEDKKRPLGELDPTQLRFTRGWHAPLTVPQHLLDSLDLLFYQNMTKALICPDRGWEKYYVTCLRLKPACLKRCSSIKGRLPVGISVDQASEMAERGRVLDAQRKQQEKNDADKEP